MYVKKIFSRIFFCDYLFQWNHIQRFLNDENTHILPIFFCDFQERNRFSKRSTISKYLLESLIYNKINLYSFITVKSIRKN
jgi:hypothetical protein